MIFPEIKNESVFILRKTSENALQLFLEKIVQYV